MLRLLSGKVILGGLALTLFAKAALSFPELPMFNTGNPVQDVAIVRTAAAEKKDSAPEPAKDIPPLVTDLPMAGSECDAPEDVLRSLTRERELVAQQKQDIEDRNAELALARERLAIEKASLTELKSSIENLLARVDAAQTDDLQRLISFYKNMKPADAARIMDDLDIETTVMVLGTMNPRTAAPILAKVSPVRARAVSKIILERSQLPGDQDLVGIKLK
ncbi:MAG: flagellar motility protein MotE (MotC chaperone) [Sulfitobacter sp.]|jgi:flagellar motility protein MotE (MotC chaperone)